MKQKTKLVIFSFLLLFLGLFYSGSSFLLSQYEFKISKFLNQISRDNELKISYNKINCSGLFSTDCKLNNLIISDEFGQILSSDLFIYDLNNNFFQNNNLHKLNIYNLKLSFENSNFFVDRGFYTVFQSTVNQLFKKSNISIFVNYRIKDNNFYSMNIKDISIDNTNFSINLSSTIDKKWILKDLNLNILLKNTFSKIMYNNFYSNLDSNGFKLINQQTLNLDSSNKLSFLEYQKNLTPLLISDLKNLYNREPLIDKNFNNALINVVKGKRFLKINITNPHNFSFVDLQKKFNDYLFSGILFNDKNKEETFLGLKVEVFLNNKKDCFIKYEKK